MSRRGEGVPVIDMSALAGCGQAATVARLALLRYRAPALGGERAGADLEQATETVHFDPAAFRPLALDNRQARYLGPVLSDAAGMVQAVTVDDLLPPEAGAAVSAPDAARRERHDAGRRVQRPAQAQDGAGQPLDRAARSSAVRHRMSATGVDDERDYLMRVQASPAEMQLLIESVVVPETWFFRYPESQQAMAQLACERLFGAGAADERVLRVLSLPCSSGEEPYSIAMALLDAVPACRFALPDRCAGHQRARGPVRAPGPVRAQFLPWRRAGLPGPLFHRDRRRHQLSAQVMEQVRFQSGNLFDAGLLAHAPAYDFVFCRNLLIYFDQATQERAVQVLRRHTREDGVLFVGPAETSLLTARRLPPVAMPHCFAFLARAPRCGAAAASCSSPRLAGSRRRASRARPRAPTHAPSGRPAAPPVVAVAAKSESRPKSRCARSRRWRTRGA